MSYPSKSLLRLRAVGGIAASLTVLAFLTALTLAASNDETTAPNQAAGVEPPALDPNGLALAMSLDTAPARQPIESEWPYPDAPVQEASATSFQTVPQPIESEWPYPDAPIAQAKTTICYDDFGDVVGCEDEQPDRYALALHSARDGQVDLAACGPEINDGDPMDCLSQE